MALEKRDYDAIVVGSGPNGLAAAILMQQQGLSVLLLEAKDTIGGGLRTKELTLPGFKHDVCSAIHPLAVASPFFKTLPLADHGLEYIYPEIDAAHPLEQHNTAILCRDIERTAKQLGADENAYLKLVKPVTKNWPLIDADVLGPLHMPKHPLALASFGLDALKPVTMLAKQFKTKQAKALLAGMAAHSMQPLTNAATAAITLVLMATGHLQGWPLPKGGSQSIADALAGYFTSIGGKIETNTYITSLDQLPSAHAVLFDVTPKQLLQIAGHKFSALYKWQLKRYRYGMGAFKVDFALSEQIPFIPEACLKAGTVHLGNTLNEIRDAEQQTWNGKHPDKPFVLLAQQSLFDNTRAPDGKHTAWAYCHVPNGSTKNMTDAIEKQIERYAPGFRDTILAKHTFNTVELEEYNPNYIGGDINGGVIDLGQLFTRPAIRLSPYRTSEKGLYICSASTPPGGGVHGMCGYNAAKKALKDVFGIAVTL
ncbi:NAD(P)/FAD-dependent oxidoreductase [Mucilaginibacter achroorhodeus]|uniref:NAD(P)/FAD-dependent oxidoreductase n=1 Tax=Mucilaginibacter achroorhodeus TaxID=2599294 RepID=A0A563U2I7_9SPHI|nr:MULTISPECIES: NAD(P)/FAD-dependent oxidoreductase [Mucilaginibacter]QXV64111.1 NAD(P)/FAD-dependent oxidoreductase [Mucilaginibacter sp. 21P]TWR25561.1 NAD(P)/FAD-dependent oxidoreductase [Mucilaginibacter achroorhodeus]